MQFVQTVATLSSRPQNAEILQSVGKEPFRVQLLALVWALVFIMQLLPAGVMSLLRPLMLDVVPSIQQTAALALGRLAEHSDALAEAVVTEDILPELIRSLGQQNVSAFREKKRDREEKGRGKRKGRNSVDSLNGRVRFWQVLPGGHLKPKSPLPQELAGLCFLFSVFFFSPFFSPLRGSAYLRVLVGEIGVKHAGQILFTNQTQMQKK